jgi:competence protein ComEC
VYHSGWKADTRLYAESQHLQDSLSVSHRWAQTGDRIEIDPSVGIQVLAPPAEKWPASFGENDASVVLRVTYGNTRILLTGDVESAAEEWLVDRYGTALASDVVKIPHHGSSTSSTGAFVAAATSSRNGVVGVVPVGERNAFGLPDPSVLRRWSAAGVHVYSTADAGAVWLRTDGRRVQSVDW